MKKVCARISALLLFILPLFSQGIQSSIVNLPLTGNWRQAAEIEKDGTAPGVQVFYDQNTGTVLQIRNDYQIRGVTEISQQFHIAGRRQLARRRENSHDVDVSTAVEISASRFRRPSAEGVCQSCGK